MPSLVYQRDAVKFEAERMLLGTLRKLDRMEIGKTRKFIHFLNSINILTSYRRHWVSSIFPKFSLKHSKIDRINLIRSKTSNEPNSIK